jgi:Flp pilus assembly protein TadG
MTKRSISITRHLISSLKSESASSLVELALSVPLLSMMLLGAVEFGRVTYAGIEVTNAARAAVQYAATNGGASADPDGIQNAAQSDAYNLGTGVTTSVYSDVCVCSGSESVQVSCTPTGSAPVCPTGQHVMETITIKATTSYNPLISFRTPMFGINGIDGPFTLQGFAQQMVLPQ